MEEKENVALTNEEIEQRLDILDEKFDVISESVSKLMHEKVDSLEKEIDFEKVAKGVGIAVGIGAVVAGGIFVYKKFVCGKCDGCDEDSDDNEM